MDKKEDENTVKILGGNIDLEFEAYGFVYITTNIINGRRYIGSKVFSSPDGSKNSWESYLGSGKALKNAVDKYGKENFTKDIIYIAASKSELEQMETYYILLYNAAYSKDYYNIKAGSNLIGNPYAGKTEEEMIEIKLKLSEAGKDKWIKGQVSSEIIGWGNQTEERKEKIRKKIGQSNKEVWDKLSPEERIEKEKISMINISKASFKGKSHTDETKELMSNIAKERFSEMDEHYLNKAIYKYSETGDLIEKYTSLSEACQSLIGTGNITNENGARSAIKRSTDKGKIVYGFRFSYGDFTDINNTPKQRKKRKGKPIEVIDVISNKSMIFDDFTDAVNYLQKDYNVVYKRFQRGTLLEDRYRIKRYNEDKIKEEIQHQINNSLTK